MNIAILIPSLKMGGAERAATMIGKHFCDCGHNVYYFLLADSGHAFFDVSGEIVKTHIIYLFSQSRIKDNVREVIFASRELKRIKKRYNINVSISFMEVWNILNVCSRNPGEKIIVSVRTVLSERNEVSGFIYDKKVLKNLYNRADRVVTVSNWVKKDLIKNYQINSNIITTIPNVSVQRESENNCDGKRWNYGNKAVICVGRLDAIKQFDHVIKAFTYVYKRDSEAKLVIIGSGSQMANLIEQRNKYQLEDAVIFEGAQSNVGVYLKNARCFVMASKVEGFPNAMVEAMAYGVPVVSTDSPGGCGEILGRNHRITDIEYCEYGVMTPYIKRKKSNDITKSEIMLGKAILKMLHDDELYEKYSKQSRVRSEYYGMKNVMKQWDFCLLKKTF